MGIYGIFLIMGNVGFISSTAVVVGRAGLRASCSARASWASRLEVLRPTGA